MVKVAPAWEWFTKLVEKSSSKPHPDVQCKFCDKVIRNSQLGRDILPHAGFKCPKAPEDVVESARAEIKKAEELKATRKPSGGAAAKRVEKRKREKAHDMTPFDGMSDDEEFSSTTPGAYDQKRLNVLLGRMCNSVGMPFSEIDSPAFHAMIAALNPNIQLPTSEQLQTVIPQRMLKPHERRD